MWMDEKRPPKRILECKPTGSRISGRLRRLKPIVGFNAGKRRR
jgi:hypothetical protein